MLGALGAWAAVGRAQAPDPLAAVTSADPMELARVVDRLGDGAVLDRLAEDSPRTVRLSAVRAARWMTGPELALAPLAELASGRDPLLAPEAARATRVIVEGLTADGLARREVEPASLSTARRRLAALAADESARSDLRAAAMIAADVLDALGVPES